MLFLGLSAKLVGLAVVNADGWDASRPSHPTLYVDTLTSKTGSSSVNVADDFFVTGEAITLGRVGIGTANPTTQLYVRGIVGSGDTLITVDEPDTSAGGAYLHLKSGRQYAAVVYTDTSSGSDWSSGMDGSANFEIKRNSGTGNVLIPSGNVGIGMLSPQGLLHTYTQSDRNFLFVDSDRNGDNPSTLQLWGKFSDGQKGKLQMIVRGNHPDQNYRDAFDFSIFDGSQWKETMMRFRRDGTVYFLQGKVGIGTESPSSSSRLTVDGGITASGSGSSIDGRAAMKLSMMGACLVAGGSSGGRWVTEGASNVPCNTLCANTKPCSDSQCLMGWTVWGLDATVHYQYGNECVGDNSINSGNPPLHICCCHNINCGVDIYR